jgi:hypothetical protein
MCLKCHGCAAKPCLLFLVRWLVDCSMCVPCAPGMLVVQGLPPLSQHPQQTQYAKCVGGKATAHAPAHRGAQLYSQLSRNNHRGDSRDVASVVSLATTRKRTRSMQQQQQQQQQQSAQQEGSTCVGTARG